MKISRKYANSYWNVDCLICKQKVPLLTAGFLMSHEDSTGNFCPGSSKSPKETMYYFDEKKYER